MNVLPFIVAALSDPSAPVRAAACQCCRALSRAVSILRTSLLDEGAGPKLFDLIVDGDPTCADGEDDVRVVAMAAVCNLVLDFSPMKQVQSVIWHVPGHAGLTFLLSLLHRTCWIEGESPS